MSSVYNTDDASSILAKEMAEFRKEYLRYDSFGKRIFNIERGKKFVHYLFRDNQEILGKLDVDNLQIGESSFTDKKLNNHTVDINYIIPLKDDRENQNKRKHKQKDKDKNENNDCVVSILIELKAQNNFWTMLQLLIYIVNIWASMFSAVFLAAKRKDATVTDKRRSKVFLLPTVIPVIFYQGRTKFSAPTKLSDLIRTVKGLEANTLAMEAILVDLSCLREEDEPEDLDLWVPFRACRIVYDSELELRLREIIDRMLPELHYPAMQELLLDVLNFVSVKTSLFTEETFNNIMDYIKEKGDFTMPTCSYLIMLNKFKKAMVRSIQSEAKNKKVEAEKRLLEAEKRQLEAENKLTKAEKEEILRTACEGYVKTVLGFLRYRFGEVSGDVKEKLLTIRDLAILRELADYVEVCPTMGAFKKKIGKVGIKN
ncbi:MAG: Rpn family recombination-promoting nuclease/putative transposase [Planctomycetaceae bacterium]|jgi:hypothetical protein|nr:Rpn family recombination-promoting nuclease/putative transposase [Planctomycetaceae bacterium]